MITVAIAIVIAGVIIESGLRRIADALELNGIQFKSMASGIYASAKRGKS